MSAAAASQNVFLEPTVERAAAIWWALLWRGILFGLLAGFVVGFVEGAIGALVGIPSLAIRIITMVSGLLASIPVGIYVVRALLRKNFRGYCIRLVATAPSTAHQ